MLTEYIYLDLDAKVTIKNFNFLKKIYIYEVYFTKYHEFMIIYSD